MCNKYTEVGSLTKTSDFLYKSAYYLNERGYFEAPKFEKVGYCRGSREFYKNN